MDCAQVCIAAIFIALSNGWTPQIALEGLQKLNPLAEKGADEAAPAPKPLVRTIETQPLPLIGAELVLLTLLASYVMKYGEVLVPFAFEPNSILGWLICLLIPAGVGYRFSGVEVTAAEPAPVE